MESSISGKEAWHLEREGKGARICWDLRSACGLRVHLLKFQETFSASIEISVCRGKFN